MFHFLTKTLTQILPQTLTHVLTHTVNPTQTLPQTLADALIKTLTQILPQTLTYVLTHILNPTQTLVWFSFSEGVQKLGSIWTNKTINEHKNYKCQHFSIEFVIAGVHWRGSKVWQITNE